MWAEIMPQRLGWGGHACMDDSLHLNQNNLHIFFQRKNHSKLKLLEIIVYILAVFDPECGKFKNPPHMHKERVLKTISK